MISASARGQEFCKFVVKKHWVFEVFMLKLIENTMCLVGFRHERARVDFVVFFARDY